MRAHVFQHVEFEGPGSIGPWLTARGYDVTRTRLFEAADLPDFGEIDLLVIMGGPMSVNDEEQYPWLVAEKHLIRQCIAAGRAVLGVCLGAQLIASAMGSRVYPNQCREIGWFAVRDMAPAVGGHFRFPAASLVFHWHGETFDLPAGAVLLAASEQCRNQAFQLGESVIGLQFHLETTPESAAALVTNCRDELVIGQCIQTAERILSAPPEHYLDINVLMHEVLAYLCRKHK